MQRQTSNTQTPAGHPADADADALLRACDVVRTRRSGPGGQHRNKVETAIVLRHRSTGIETQAAKRRSQAENLRAAIGQLRLKLALSVRTARPAAAVPSALWRSRCRNRRIVVAVGHSDFPSLLAEALDVVMQRDGDVKAAAESLSCTPSQLVRLFEKEPEALALLNAARSARALRRLW